AEPDGAALDSGSPGAIAGREVAPSRLGSCRSDDAPAPGSGLTVGLTPSRSCQLACSSGVVAFACTGRPKSNLPPLGCGAAATGWLTPGIRTVDGAAVGDTGAPARAGSAFGVAEAAPPGRVSVAISLVSSAIRSSGSSFWPLICCGFAGVIGSAL